MEKTKDLETLREQLAEFEKDIINSIRAELIRIDRSVRMDEFVFVPFNEEMRDYVDAIRLDSNNNVVLDTSFNDTNQKYLSDIISDDEIEHWNVIALLELLTAIQK